MRRFKKISLSSFLLLLTFSLFAQTVPDRPNPQRLVNDFTNTLTESQKQALEQKLVALDDSTSTQIAVVIVESTNGQTIADYDVALLRKWGVGSKKNNNGVILLVAKKDRELDITVGYGLEGALTDATSKQIIDDIIVPNFKGNDYYRGIDQGTDAIMQAVRGEFHEERQRTSSGSSRGGSSIFFIIIIIVLILIFSGRGGGGNSNNYMSRRGSGIANALLWSTLFNGGGSGGGGGWSGGGGGGGGFGGFGGGSGGGGGASGSW